MEKERPTGDEIYIQSVDGNQTGPVTALTEGNKFFIRGENLSIEKGGKLLRPLPDGRRQIYSILETNFYRDPNGGRLSHYEVAARLDETLAPPPASAIRSQGTAAGGAAVPDIIRSLESLYDAIEKTSATDISKQEVKSKMKAFLSHPVTIGVLGAAIGKLLGKL